jgi:hypothetical protein
MHLSGLRENDSGLAACASIRNIGVFCMLLRVPLIRAVQNRDAWNHMCDSLALLSIHEQ